MAEYSLYKSLELPSSTEHYNIGVFNKNTTVIDSELHKLDLINESLSNHTTDELNPHKVKKSQIGLSNVDNTSDINKPVSTAQQNAIDESLYQSNYYTDTKIAELINGAPETLDTLKEIADAIIEDKTIVDAIDAAIGTKANQNELNTHINNDAIHVTQSDKTNISIAKEHADSQHARVDATKVEKSDTNGNIKINGVETNVYTPSSSTELPLTTSLDSTEEGVAALDSTVGKVLKDEIDELNNNLGGLSFYEDTNGNKYVVGADAVPKKLGSSVANFTISATVTVSACYAVGGAGTSYNQNIIIKYNNDNMSVTGAPSAVLGKITGGDYLKLSGFKINSIVWD